MAEVSDSEVRDFIITSIAAIHGLLLAFLIIVVWEKYSSLRESVAMEAGAIMNVARGTKLLPPADRIRVLDELAAYTHEVIDDDWPKLREAGHQDTKGLMKASQTLSKLWAEVGKYEFSIISENMMGNLDSVSKERVRRFAIAREGVPVPLWAALAVGTMATIIFAVFRHQEALDIKNIFMFAWFAVFLVAMLWILIDLDYPFGGTQNIEPTPFEHAIRVIEAQRAK